MELHIQSEFDCVCSVNGEFCESPVDLDMNEYDVVYVTVFPLDVSLLPYTVKLISTQNINTPLYVGIRLSPEHYLLNLMPRRPVLYSSSPAAPKNYSSAISRLFALVKSGETNAAYAMLSDNLKSVIDKKTLETFFDDYERLIDCKWLTGGKFYLVTEGGNARLHSYTVKDEFIDDITELDE